MGCASVIFARRGQGFDELPLKSIKFLNYVTAWSVANTEYSLGLVARSVMCQMMRPRWARGSGGRSWAKCRFFCWNSMAVSQSNKITSLAKSGQLAVGCVLWFCWNSMPWFCWMGVRLVVGPSLYTRKVRPPSWATCEPSRRELGSRFGPSRAPRVLVRRVS